MSLHVPDWAMPFFDPFPRPFIDHIYANRVADAKTQSLDLVLSRLLSDCHLNRIVVYLAMNPVVVLGKFHESDFSIQWYLDKLSENSPGKRQVSRALLSFWYKSNLFRYHAHGYPDPEDAATMFLARLLDEQRVRGWMPARLEGDERVRWCWWQEHPHAELLPCPLPLPPRFPMKGILVRLWPSWESEWLRYDCGAIRWVAANSIGWDVAPEEVADWDRSLGRPPEAIPETVGEYEGIGVGTHQSSATTTLHRLAYSYFVKRLPMLEKQLLEKGVSHEQRSRNLLVRCGEGD